ncbi:MAG: class I SAM-dependent methyltransferase [Theionarchaea archaeon]|nr:class I SAM-dependent methyltransferase [Theionarchaea archaeon]
MGKKQVNNWIDYWDSENIFDRFKWQIFTNTFATSTESLLHYNSKDIVLDIGCGPGYLAAALQNKIKEFHGVETSQRFLDMARKKFSHEKNIFFYRLNREDYTNFSFLKDRGLKFSKIICLSVIQYYDSINDVKKLIEEVRTISAPGAKFIIADIKSSTLQFSDVAGFLRDGINRGILRRMLRFLVFLGKSDYTKLLSSKGLLTLSVEKIHEIVEEHNLDAQLLTMQLTANKNRKHLLITFS